MSGIIGNENVARMHDADGDTDLARIQRLTPGQAASMLNYLAGRAPDAMAEAFKLAEGWT